MIDVSDPKNPKLANQIECKHSGVHSHKVRAKDGIMLTNYEAIGYAGDPDAAFRGGLNIYDLSDPHSPEPIHFWECDGSGIHRFTWDGRYAYISPEIEGYDGNICMILDLKDPKNPRKSGAGTYRANGPPAASSPLGRIATRVVIIRCAWAIDFMSATGTPVGTFSTFRTCRSRR